MRRQFGSDWQVAFPCIEISQFPENLKSIAIKIFRLDNLESPRVLISDLPIGIDECCKLFFGAMSFRVRMNCEGSRILNRREENGTIVILIRYSAILVKFPPKLTCFSLFDTTGGQLPWFCLKSYSPFNLFFIFQY